MPHMGKVRACRLDMRSGAMPSASPAVLARKMVENPVHMPIHVTMISARRPAFSIIPIAMNVIAKLTSESSVVASCGSATFACVNISVE